MFRRACLPCVTILLACSGCDRSGDSGGTVQRDRLGEHLVARSNCLACHQATDGVHARIGTLQAPLLNDVGARMSPAAMRDFILDPAATRGRHDMPSLLHGLPREEQARLAEDIVHYLQSLGGPFRAEAEQVMPSVPEHGRRIWETIGCFACHEQDDAPRLAGQTSMDAMESFLLDPLATHPSARMPSMHLEPGEAHALAAWLLREQSNLDSLTEEPGLVTEVYEIDREIRRGNLSEFEPVDNYISDEVTADPFDGQDMFALRMRGSIEIPETGEWSFHLSSDDGSWLWIDGELVIDNGAVHPVTTKEAILELEAGRHSIQVVHFELGGAEELELEWKGPGASQHELIPPGAFSSQMATYVPPGSDFVPDQDRVAAGEDLFVKFGCAACHVPGIPATRTPFMELQSGRGCLADTVAVATPDFGFSPEEKASIDAVLGYRDAVEEPLSPLVAVDHAMLGLNCYACHVRDGIGGPSQVINPMFTSEADLGDEGRLPPDLSGVGNKLHRQWMEEVFDGATVRPAMQVRMPRYGHAVEALPGMFHAADAIAGDELSPPFSVDAARVGHDLVGSDGFKCIECHSFDGLASLGEPGVDLSTTLDRIRPGWFQSWLLDPTGMRPGTRMPAYFASEHAIFPDVLEGDSQRQVDAIWSYLSLGASMPLPAGLQPDPGSYQLAAIDEPVLFGTFMEGVSPRTIAVAYPQRAHVAWDSEHDRMALIWRGDFMDARGTWHQRAGAVQWPDGTAVIEPPPGPAVTVLASDDEPWPEARGIGVGIRRDADRSPYFLTRQGELDIAEHARALLWEGGSRVHRMFEVTSPGFVTGVHVRAAQGDRIVDEGDGRFSIDDDLQITVLDGEGTIRSIDGMNELLVPILLRQGGDGSGNWTGTAKVEVAW